MIAANVLNIFRFFNGVRRDFIRKALQNTILITNHIAIRDIAILYGIDSCMTYDIPIIMMSVIKLLDNICIHTTFQRIK